MKTIVQFGPRDHGRAVTSEDLNGAHYQEGFRYEVIEGRLYVSPLPNVPHDVLVEWLQDCLKAYSRSNPTVINYVSSHPRVFVPGNEEITAPEPDLAAYADFPTYGNVAATHWSDLQPLWVAEVVSEDDPDKDLVRNVELFRQAPSIREYWILDPVTISGHLRMLVYRRRGLRWQKAIVINEGETYEARFPPGFSLILNP
jgi:Uma2 family endonuclease